MISTDKQRIRCMPTSTIDQAEKPVAACIHGPSIHAPHDVDMLSLVPRHGECLQQRT